LTFSGRRFSGGAGCLKALPKPLDILSSVNVPVKDKTTMMTGMNTNRQAFGNSGPATGAELSCVFGGDFDNLSASFFRFALENTEELKPSHISHRPIHTTPAIPR